MTHTKGMIDEQTVERVAEAIYSALAIAHDSYDPNGWNQLSEQYKEMNRIEARAALAAMTGLVEVNNGTLESFLDSVGLCNSCCGCPSSSYSIEKPFTAAIVQQPTKAPTEGE